MDDRWPGSSPTPPEQPAGEWGVPEADQRPAFPPYLPPPTPAAEPPIGPAEPVAEPGWAWRTNRPPTPPEQDPEPSYLPYEDQRYEDQARQRQQYESQQYAGHQYPSPAYPEQRYEDQRYEDHRYEEHRYEEQAYPAQQRHHQPHVAAAGARAAATVAEPLSESPVEPVDEAAPARPGLLGTLLWTLGAFLVPLLVYLGWAATLSTTPRPGCVDVAGGPCPGPRAQAVTNLLNVLPAVVVALGAALLLALGIRYIAVTWRSYKVAFAASVIGAGVTTLLVSALN
ncbi:hypothetical protein JQS43_25675 [Natronosporangium hydrolyticum]|uniref:Uncharacterized protein n=1 Tax=Natronosporangium hydrolyticum TaxID=2811111 RepID=A0A895YL12_9ACTN|nr:hypothetical protein [Natronosporangium hydrolyticum]QSB14790.1 hypothetical protein JQS43_25675 [Natronosporangium hydrolyticum]